MFGNSVLVRERSGSHPGGAVVPEFLLTRDQRDRLQSSFERYAVTFGLYRNQQFQDRLFPFGAVPRIIGRWEFDTLEKGLMQRIDALNLFLKDVYGPAHIVKDKVVPADFLYASTGFLPEVRGLRPPKDIFCHVAGIDLVQERNGTWIILEDNLRVPSGAAYPLIARKTYRRLSDDFLDPLAFREDSMVGVPGLFDVLRRGGVALLNAPGNGVADDKGIYYFVPELIRYYLNQEPTLANAPTYLAAFDRDRSYILEHLGRLVVKDVAEAGGYGVVFGQNMSRSELAVWKERIRAQPRRYIAQEIVDFCELSVLRGDRVVRRKADFRAFVLSGSSTRVWASGLTRYAVEKGSLVVNSSQGGGFKDTWVLSR
ncbi:MAG TPA: circularly permuted type 2 ATP-grasp protein [Spirochaetia bacterium]|nr:circularly permuted type 2 ATP-grasp protein [Spirochaetia bacterium]